MREIIRTAVLTAGDGKETPAAWQSVSIPALGDPWLTDAGTLLTLFSKLTDDAPADPVAELRAFVSRPSFDLTADAFEVTIPDALRPERFAPGPELSLSVAGTTVPYERVGIERIARGERTYRFRVAAEATKMTLKPGDSLTVRLKGTVSSAEHELVWDRGRSAVFPFDRVRLEPVLAEPSGRSERAVGVTVRVVPEGGWPALPLLVPDFADSR